MFSVFSVFSKICVWDEDRYTLLYNSTGTSWYRRYWFHLNSDCDNCAEFVTLGRQVIGYSFWYEKWIFYYYNWIVCRFLYNSDSNLSQLEGSVAAPPSALPHQPHNHPLHRWLEKQVTFPLFIICCKFVLKYGSTNKDSFFVIFLILSYPRYRKFIFYVGWLSSDCVKRILRIHQDTLWWQDGLSLFFLPHRQNTFCVSQNDNCRSR